MRQISELETTLNHFLDWNKARIIPIVINNGIFELRQSCRQIVDRKWHSINAYNAIYDRRFSALSRSSNMPLFITIGITFLIQILQALFIVRTLNLTQIAQAFCSNAKEESVYPRIQRFFGGFSFDMSFIVTLACKFFADLIRRALFREDESFLQELTVFPYLGLTAERGPYDFFVVYRGYFFSSLMQAREEIPVNVARHKAPIL